MAPLGWGLRLNKTTFYPQWNLLQLSKLKIRHMVTLLWLTPCPFPAHRALPAAVPQWSTVVLGMRCSLRDMTWLWVLLRCAQPLLNSIYRAVKSYFTGLFLNLLRHHGFFTNLVFITPVCYRLSFQSAYGHPVFTWVIAIFVGVSLSSSFSLVIKSIGGFAREAWQEWGLHATAAQEYL